MKKGLFLLMIIAGTMLSCEKDEIIDPDNLILGVWNNSGYEDDVQVFTRSQKFIDNYGYNFINDGSMIARQNSGFCGTPPITYADYSGSWTIINDTLISIKVGFWGGTNSYKLDIESVDATTLRVRYVQDSK